MIILINRNLSSAQLFTASKTEAIFANTAGAYLVKVPGATIARQPPAERIKPEITTIAIKMREHTLSHMLHRSFRKTAASTTSKREQNIF